MSFKSKWKDSDHFDVVSHVSAPAPLQEATSLYQSLRQKQGFQIGTAAKNRSKAVERGLEKPFAPMFVPPR